MRAMRAEGFGGYQDLKPVWETKAPVSSKVVVPIFSTARG
jgi:hypothetical protein